MKPAFSRSPRLLLLAGFGGLLLLMGFGGLGAARILQTIQQRNDIIRKQYLTRSDLLNQIRAGVYVSGTYVRDYVLEPDSARAESHRASLDQVRAEMSSSLAQYKRQVEPGQQSQFQALEAELAAYWKTLDPVLHWSTAERRDRGYPFLRDAVFPRRASVLRLADAIARINEQQLEHGSGQVANLFSAFRARLLLALGGLLLLGGALALFSVRRILQLEREASLRLQDVERTQGELKELSQRLVDAQEDERRAISRELHDEIGQGLSALVLGLGNLSSSLPREGPVAESVAALRAQAQTSVGVVRDMALLLRPSMLDDLGLLPALQWQAREVSKRTGMIVNVAAHNFPESLPDQQKTCIYRVVQEALHNAEKHARAHQARVTLQQQEGQIAVSVQDDGRGFRPEEERGLGLIGIGERVEHLGGTCKIDSTPGRGTLLTVLLPATLGARGDGENVG